MADPDVSCPVCAAMYRPETPPDNRTAAELLAEFDALQAARGVAVFRPMSDPYRHAPTLAEPENPANARSITE